MEANSIFMLVDVVTIAIGFYSLYTCIYMKKNNAIFDNKLLMSDKNPVDQCKDPKGYIKYTFPRLLIFSILCIAMGGLSFYGDHAGIFPFWAQQAITFGLLALLVWLWLILRKTIQLFW